MPYEVSRLAVYEATANGGTPNGFLVCKWDGLGDEYRINGALRKMTQYVTTPYGKRWQEVFGTLYGDGGLDVFSNFGSRGHPATVEFFYRVRVPKWNWVGMRLSDSTVVTMTQQDIDTNYTLGSESSHMYA